MICRIRDKEILGDRCQNSENACRSKRCRAIAAEFRSARNLPPDAGDVAECLIEWMDREAHRNSLYNAKYRKLAQLSSHESYS